jgi:deoxyribodipyrimidine photolyase-related protein
MAVSHPRLVRTRTSCRIAATSTTRDNDPVATPTRWLFGDQLGSHFLDDDQQPLLLVESRAVFRRRTFHRAKAHLVLSAMRHLADELGDRVTYVRAETYGEAIERVGGPLEVVHPTSRGALGLVHRHAGRITVLPARGFVTRAEEFAAWAGAPGRGRLRLEDFYRDARRRTGILMEADGPVGGRWNFDADNREPPPKGADRLGAPEPWWPAEDDIDAEVRFDLDRWQLDGLLFAGRDGPRRFAATRDEAGTALRTFVERRLGMFGPFEDAMLGADPWMAHSLLSAPMNLGLIDPAVAIREAEDAYHAGTAPLSSVEGFVRQLLGWRDYMWHLYWWLPPEYGRSNALDATRPLPDWFASLDAEAVEAQCLRSCLERVRDHGWAHHIERLMVLGNWALQRGYDPASLTDWFHRMFVDGHDWVMQTNVVGLSQYADGGLLATKPYASGGAYINRMSDHCGHCRYRPSVRLGSDACPFTAGYWAFLDRAADVLRDNHRMAPVLAGLTRLADREAVVAQERLRSDSPP